MRTTLDRRRFLTALGGCLAGTVGMALPAPEDRGSRLIEWLETELKPDARSRELGRAYLERFPELADRERLERLIDRPPGSGSGWLRERVVSEFRRGATLFLDGWLVSETEARLCALAHLARGSAAAP